MYNHDLPHGVKRYALQFRKFKWDRWETWPNLTFDTLEEAQAALDRRMDKSSYRIVQAYVVIRYKPVN